MLVIVAENHTPKEWNNFKKKALWANIANYQKMEIIIGILAEMSTLPSLQVVIFILQQQVFTQFNSYLNNYPYTITLFKPWLYLSHLDVYNIVILSTALKCLCQKNSGTDPVGLNPRSVTSMAEVRLQKSKIAKKVSCICCRLASTSQLIPLTQSPTIQRSVNRPCLICLIIFATNIKIIVQDPPDLVITVCDRASETCPRFPAKTKVLLLLSMLLSFSKVCLCWVVVC